MILAEPSSSQIFALPQLIGALPLAERRRFERIFQVQRSVGQLQVPPAFHDEVCQTFGSIGVAETQPLLKITNLITLEGALFNPLRARRPMPGVAGDLSAAIEADRGIDAFCHPYERTADDLFGRLKGDYSLTASNIAKLDAYHGLVIFNEHDPLAFSEASIQDAFDVGLRWAKAAHNVDRSSPYFFMLWNGLWKAGASQVHGHAQVLMTKGMHYPKVEQWRRAAQLYRLGHGANYFEDLLGAHTALGLSCEMAGVPIVAHLTPAREHEMLILGQWPDASFSKAVYHALDTLVRGLGARSFSLALYLRPIDGVTEDWDDFPAIVRLVDRGDPFSRTTDVGSLELFAISAISSDPFTVAHALHDRLPAG